MANTRKLPKAYIKFRKDNKEVLAGLEPLQAKQVKSVMIELFVEQENKLRTDGVILGEEKKVTAEQQELMQKTLDALFSKILPENLKLVFK